MTKLKFKPNQSVKIYKVPNSPTKYDAKILARGNFTLILTRPQIVKQKNVVYMNGIEPNSMIYGEYEYDGKKYYFKTKVIKCNFTPFPYIIVREPQEKDVKIKPIRRADRFKSYLPISILFEKEKKVVKFLQSYSIDLSITGIGFLTSIELPDNFKIELSLYGESVKLTCEKKNFIPQKVDRFNFIGAEIKEIENSEIYKNYIEHLKLINEATEEL